MSYVPPAEGERTAIRSFEAQYRLASTAVLRALRAGRLESVRMVDPAMGRVDDFVLTTPTEARGHQVKWSEHPDTLTLNQMMIAGRGGAPSLFRQLADGWSRLRASFPSRLARVTLIHHGILSTSDVSGAPASSPQRHFAAFYTRVWCAVAVPVEWQPVVDDIQNHTGLDATDFEAFRHACRIESLLDAAPADESAVQIAAHEDEAELRQFLRAAVVASPARTAVKFTRRELLRALDWQQRFSQNFQHDFPTPADYVANQAVEAQLVRCLQDTTSGYVALVGGPGSGKSTLLTQFLTSADLGHVVRYYAFVPDGVNDTRGDASRFLHDLVSALDQSGLPARDSLDLAAQQQQLIAALAAAGERFRSTGRRTVILVDGLDHVQRARPLSRSLLAVLPSPPAFPEGVVMLVGSQRLDLDDLPNAVRTQCELSTRRIDMRALAPEESLRLMQQALGAVSEADHSVVHARTQGHPLSLRLVLDALRDRPDHESIEEVLDRIAMVGADLGPVYEQAWRVATREGCADALALVARLRHAFGLRDLLVWVGEAPVTALREHLAFLFRPIAAHVWVFQHDSFRHFLLVTTQLDALGDRDTTRDQQWHHQLAAWALQHEGPFHDEVLHHAARSGDTYSVVANASVEHFRAAFHRGRPIALLGSDLDEVLRSARALDDPHAVAQALAIQGELTARANALYDVDLLGLTYDCDGAAAVRQALHGGYGRIDLEDGMALASRLVTLGEWELAREVFEAAEPLALLHDLEPTSMQDPEALVLWADVARHFRPLSTIITRLVRPDVGQDVDDRRLDRLTHFAYYLRCDSDHVGCAAALAALEESERETVEEMLAWWRLERDRMTPPEISAFWDAVSRRDLLPDEQALLAERLLRVAHAPDAARAALDQWAPEPLGDAVHQDHTYQSRQMALLRGWRVCAALDAAWSPSLDVGNIAQVLEGTPAEARALPVRLRLRTIERLAKAWGAAWRGDRWSVDATVEYLKPVWKVLTEARGGDPHVQAMQHRSAKPILFYCLEAAAAHGNDQGGAVAQALLAQFADSPDRQHQWGLPVLEAAHGLTDAQRLAALHEFLEAWSAGSGPETLAAWAELAHAFATLGDCEGARACRRALFSRSFVMIYDKDYTPIEASTYLRRAVQDADPDAARSWILRFAAALERADNAKSQAGRGYHEAWCDVVRSAALVSPEFGLAVWQAGFARKIPLDESLVGLTLAFEKEASPVLLLATIVAIIAPLQGSARRAIEALMQRLAATLDTRERNWAHAVLQASAHPSLAGSYAQALVFAPSPSLALETESHERISLAGEELTLPEVAALYADANILVPLLASARASEYTWNKLLPPLIARCDAAQLHAIRDVMTSLEFPFQAVTAIADRLDQAGDRAGAVALLDQALTQRAEGSWAPWADGGARLALFRALVKYQPAARTAAWHDFVASRLSPRRYAWHATAFDVLDNVQFALDLPAAVRWNLLECYLAELTPFRLNRDGWEVSDSGALSADEVLLVVLHRLLTLPVPRLASRALLALAAAAPVGRLRPLLARQLTQDCGDDREQLESLRALYLLQTLPEWNVDLDALLAGDALHPHLAMRHLVSRLRARPMERGPRALSPFYRLQTPDLPRTPHPWSDRGAAAPLSDLVDDESLVLRLLRREVAWLADTADLAPEILVRRTVTLYQAAGGAARYGEAAQREAVRLRLPFSRIRMVALRDAFSRVAAELFDAGRVPPAALPLLRAIAERDDIRFALPPAVPPPAAWISRMKPQRLDEDWSLLDLPLQLSDDAYALAAWIEFHAYDRMAQYWHVAVPSGHNRVTSVQERMMSTVDYLDASIPDDCLAVILANYVGPMEPDFIVAFNPSIARALNWDARSAVGADWRDRQGRPMTYTLHFALSNDLLNYGPRAVGSAVVATAAGVAALRTRYPSGTITVSQQRNSTRHETIREEWFNAPSSGDHRD